MMSYMLWYQHLLMNIPVAAIREGANPALHQGHAKVQRAAERGFTWELEVADSQTGYLVVACFDFPSSELEGDTVFVARDLHRWSTSGVGCYVPDEDLTIWTVSRRDHRREHLVDDGSSPC